MKLKDLKEVSNDININDYLWLYNYVRKNMPVCSVFYIPSSNKSLSKHHIDYDESITGSLGPIIKIIFIPSIIY